MENEYIILIYPKPDSLEKHIELYGNSEMQKMLERIVTLTKEQIKFTILRVGECVGDFS